MLNWDSIWYKQSMRMLLITLSTFMFINSAFSKTYETGLEGIIVKNVGCYSYVKGKVVNKTSVMRTFDLVVEIFNQDGNLVGKGNQRINLNGNSKASVRYIGDTDCRGASTYKFSATPK